MADTSRSRTEMLALYPINVTKLIGAQDGRDFVVSAIPEECEQGGDFFQQPLVEYLTTDKTGRGWKEYSQTIESTVSFGAPVCMTQSGTWRPANLSVSVTQPVHGIALDSYATGVSTATILRAGLVYDSLLSARFSNYIGRPVYLQSAAYGSIDTTVGNSTLVVGYVEGTTHWRFNPDVWTITGN